MVYYCQEFTIEEVIYVINGLKSNQKKFTIARFNCTYYIKTGMKAVAFMDGKFEVDCIDKGNNYSSQTLLGFEDFVII